MLVAEIVHVVGIKIGRDVVHKDVQQGMTKIFRKDSKVLQNNYKV